MSVEDYCYFVGIPISLGLDRKPKTTKIDLRITPIQIPGCTPKNSVSVKVINQKTIIEWLLEDKPEFLGEILSKGLGQYLEKLNITQFWGSLSSHKNTPDNIYLG